MENFESVIARMPAGGEVRYFQYRHPAISADWGSQMPWSAEWYRDETRRPFLSMVVLIEQPECFDEEGYRYGDCSQETAVGVVHRNSADFCEWIESESDGKVKTWRRLCEPA